MRAAWHRVATPARLLLVALVAQGLVGCAQVVAPPHVAPVDVPAAWATDSRTTVGTTVWVLAQPGDHEDKGRWWQGFADPDLDALVNRALQDNPSVAVAQARLSQAKALLGQADAARSPRVDLLFKDTRTRTSANRPATTASSQSVSSIQNDGVLSAAVSYEPDLFGRQRLGVSATQASLAQAQADWRNAQLVLVADVTNAYSAVRATDEERKVLAQSLAAQVRASTLLATRQDGGIASSLDVAQQQAQVDATRTQLTLLNKQREAQVHALAVLVGTAPSAFRLPERVWAGRVPIWQVDVPSTVLQRRPDVASAERAVAAANAQVGLAEKAWFPSLTLGVSGGWEARDLAQLFEAPSLLWAVGGQVAQNLFDGGRNRALLAQAQASRDGLLANYRQTVLRALQEVDDGLSNLQTLAQAQREAEAAVASARKVLDLAQARYEGGLVTYLDVVTAQQNVLTNQRLSVQLRGQQVQAATYLIKALGGQWGADQGT